MLNLFQHLVVSMGYETLKQVQGDIPVIYTQTLTINWVRAVFADSPKPLRSRLAVHSDHLWACHFFKVIDRCHSPVGFVIIDIVTFSDRRFVLVIGARF